MWKGLQLTTFEGSVYKEIRNIIFYINPSTGSGTKKERLQRTEHFQKQVH